MTIENKNIDFLYSDLTADLYSLYKKSSYLAIDTEAMGLIHGRDRLCLVQICNEFGRTACIKIELDTSSSPHLKSLLCEVLSSSIPNNSFIKSFKPCLFV